MEKTVIIAEAGVNHNGDLELAKQMVKAAKESGADIVKFQITKLESLVSKFALMVEYPAPFETVNLKVMLTLKEKFQTDVGYSDHTMGTEICITRF